jgi:hypothetical protein
MPGILKIRTKIGWPTAKPLVCSSRLSFALACAIRLSALGVDGSNSVPLADGANQPAATISIEKKNSPFLRKE